MTKFQGYTIIGLLAIIAAHTCSSETLLGNIQGAVYALMSVLAFLAAGLNAKEN